MLQQLIATFRWPDDESALKRAKAARKKAGEEETDEFDGKTSRSALASCSVN